MPADFNELYTFQTLYYVRQLTILVSKVKKQPVMLVFKFGVLGSACLPTTRLKCYLSQISDINGLRRPRNVHCDSQKDGDG